MDRVGAVLVETYKITRLIAEGGMGYVFEAQHVRIPKRFAVKFLKGALLDKTEAVGRFRREAEIIATLEHPHIVTLVDYNVGEDSVPYIILEFLDGEHLGLRMARGPMTLEETLKIVDPVSRALSVAHKRDVIHRDLKPENVMLCTSGVVKVVDFGVAKLHGATGLTAFNTTVGTVPYMSPEQILGGGLDGRSDQFSLGAIVYEMLSGGHCFGGGEGSIPDQALKVLRHEPPPLPSVPEAVNAVILKALSKEAADRFDSMDDFREALAAASHEATVPALGAAPADEAERTGELAPLGSEATAVTTQPPRPMQVTPTAQVSRDQLLPPGSTAPTPRITGPSMRAVDPTSKIGLPWRAWLENPRVLSVVAGTAVGAALFLIYFLVR